jgi:drug/metabolite transporter (DMT)-like permease
MGAPLLALAAALCFAVSGVLIKRALQSTPLMTVVAVSVTFTAAFVWLVAAATAPLAQVTSPAVLPFLAAGVAAPGLARIALFLGVHRVGVARAASAAGVSPLFSVALAILFLGERPSPLLLVGALAIVAGGVLLAQRALDDRSWRRRDLLLPVLAALAFALRDTVSRWGFREPVHPLVAAAGATAVSFVVIAGFVTIRRDPVRLGLAGLGYLALAGVAEGGAYLTMWRALALADVSVVAPLVNAHGIFAVTLAALFLRDVERVTLRTALAAVLIVGGVAAVIRFGTA